MQPRIRLDRDDVERLRDDGVHVSGSRLRWGLCLRRRRRSSRRMRARYL
jgi:hypothetical protein